MLLLLASPQASAAARSCLQMGRVTVMTRHYETLKAGHMSAAGRTTTTPEAMNALRSKTHAEHLL
jgi:hypothetical protein